MSTGQHVGLRTEDMICCPRVVGPCAFAADVAVGGGLPHESSSFWVVALVVRAAGVPDCLTLALAGWASGGGGGESSALDAWALNWHQTSFNCSLIAFIPLIVQLQSQHDAAVLA